MEEYFAEGVMEMPTPCMKCGGVFDLNDGVSVDDGNVIYCHSCGSRENEKAEIYDEIEGLEMENENMFSELRWNRNRLKELKEQLSKYDGIND